MLGKRPALRTHQDIVESIAKIKCRLSVPRDKLLRAMFDVDCDGSEDVPDWHDQNRAFGIAAGTLLLMDFGILHDAANMTPANASFVHWRDNVSHSVFVQDAFVPEDPTPGMHNWVMSLKARRLKREAKLRLAFTNDIRSHLVLDKKQKTLWIFHQTTALRQLLATTEAGVNNRVLPREVILEVWHTVHTVLFPLDTRSQKLLKRLVTKEGWSKGLLTDLPASDRENNDIGFEYKYFGRRLEDLHKELQNPTPHTWLQRRLKRRSEDYMLMATMYGVIIAVTLSLLSLIVAILQSWIAWQQWKHPVK
jgi:hypothetical protein